MLKARIESICNRSMQKVANLWDGSCAEPIHSSVSRGCCQKRPQAEPLDRSAARFTRICVMAPAEDALVGACKRGRGLHASVRLNAIEGMLVAAATSTQHALRPSAQLDPRMRPCTLCPLQALQAKLLGLGRTEAACRQKHMTRLHPLLSCETGSIS